VPPSVGDQLRDAIAVWYSDTLYPLLVEEITQKRETFKISLQKILKSHIEKQLESICNLIKQLDALIGGEETDLVLELCKVQIPEKIPIVNHTPPNENTYRLDDIHKMDYQLHILPTVQKILPKIVQKGFVYVLSISAYKKGLYKIGKTGETAETRSTALYKTGVPEEFKVETRWQTNHRFFFEKIMHDLFALCRTNPSREYCEVSTLTRRGFK
jgi:hypothetical protein